MSAVQEVYEFLKKCGTWYLATVEGDQPRVRPFGAIAIIDGKLATQTGHIKPVSKQLDANPKAEICGFAEGQWIRIACKLIEDPSIETQEAMLEANPSLKRMYAAGDGNTEVLIFTEATATISSFGGEPRVLTF